MQTLRDRFVIAPQMADYDELTPCWSPYLMFFQPPHFKRNSVSTDERGFRTTYHAGKPIQIVSLGQSQCNLFVGASTAFGVGSTHDQQTIPSLLNRSNSVDDGIWLNLGGRAFTSTQEFILFTTYRRYFNNINKVVIFSGVNDLLLYMTSLKYCKDLGSLFFSNAFLKGMNQSGFKSIAARKALRILFRPIYGDRIDFDRVSIRTMVDFLLKKASFEELLDTIQHSVQKDIVDHETEKEDLLSPLQNNLANWRIFSKQMEFEITYVLQPFKNWIDKELSEEEETLFSILDGSQDDHRKGLFKNLGMDKYDWFLGKIKGMCKENGIEFFDMNKYFSENKFDKKWLFVDRIHLTDEGNQICADVIMRIIR